MEGNGQRLFVRYTPNGGMLGIGRLKKGRPVDGSGNGLVAPGGAGGGKNEPESDRISNLPCSVTTDPAAVGCRIVTFVTVPLPLSTQIPRCRRRAYPATHSNTSHPLATSKMCARSVFALSRVIITGGFGLFFDPAGLPLGRRATISPPPPPPPPQSPSSLLSGRLKSGW
nr:hypothetical protein PanWU01x14_089000 [Ipomoea trifida]